MIPGLRFSDLKPNLRECAAIAKIGLPAAAQMGMLNLSYVLATGMFNAHGLTVAVASGIGLKVNTAVAMPTWAIGQAVITMAGQCLGAGKHARAKQAALVGLAINLGMNAVMVAAIRLCAGSIVGIFTTEPAVVAEATRYLSICCSFNFLFYAAMVTLDSFATGTGNTLFAMVNSLIHSVALRLTLSAFLAWGLHWGASGLYWGEALSPIVSCIVAAVWFSSGVWNKGNKEDTA
jgi:Na+-driven multidrug efflux pump